MDSESLANDSRLDDLYDYDDDQQDDAHEAHANRPPVPSAFEHLGIDEEVKITKSKRRAVPLDETRYVSRPSACMHLELTAWRKTGLRSRHPKASESLKKPEAPRERPRGSPSDQV